jgi:hypothetical protein
VSAEEPISRRAYQLLTKRKLRQRAASLSAQIVCDRFLVRYGRAPSAEIERLEATTRLSTDWQCVEQASSAVALYEADRWHVLKGQWPVTVGRVSTMRARLATKIDSFPPFHAALMASMPPRPSSALRWCRTSCTPPHLTQSSGLAECRDGFSTSIVEKMVGRYSPHGKPSPPHVITTEQTPAETSTSSSPA